MMPMEAASWRLKPKSSASPRVRKIPTWAVRPKRKTLGLESRGVKSHMAPTAMKMSRGKSSVWMPAWKSRVSAPSVSLPPAIWSRAEVKGMFTRMVPKPMGRSRFGSNSLTMARYISAAPTPIMMSCLYVNARITDVNCEIRCSIRLHSLRVHLLCVRSGGTPYS